VDAAGHARITDFGLATVTKNLDSLRSATGGHGNAARWTAPEILTGEETFSKEADIFSFAMVMIEVSADVLSSSRFGPPTAPYCHRDLPVQLRSMTKRPRRPY